MTVDVSTLGIEVKSTGIDTATKGLVDLGNAAEKTEQQVATMTGTMKKLLNLNATATMQAWTSAMGGTNTAMSQLASTIQNTVNAINTQVASLNNLVPAYQNATRAQQEHSASSGVFLNTLKAMTAAALAYMGINFAASIIHAADKWTDLNVKMVAATGSQNNATVALRDAYDIAQRLGTPLEGTVKLYARLAPALASVGFASKDVHDVVVGLSSAFHLGGATTGEMNQAILNFSHSMSSGHMNLRAFNALTAEAPLLLRALANQMTGGNMDALRTLVSAHKVGAKDIVDAIHTVQPEWDKLITNRPVTVEMEITRIKNTWLKSIGEMAQDTQFNSKLAEGLQIVEKMIPEVAHGLGEAFGAVFVWVNKNKSMLMDIWNQVVGLAKDVIKAGVGFSAWIASLIQADDQFSLIAEVIFGIRLAFAFIQDLVKGIVELFFALHLDSILTIPLKVALLAMGGIAMALEGWLRIGAKIAGVMGKTELAGSLQAAAESAHGFAEGFNTAYSSIDGTMNKVRKSTQGWTQDILDGKGAVSQLMDSGAKAAEQAAADKKKYDENFNKNPTTAPDPKAIAAAEKLTKEFEKQKESLTVMVDEQKELSSRLSQYGLEYDKLGPAQKELIKLQDQQALNIANHASTLVKMREAALIGLASQAAALEKINEEKLTQLHLDEKLLQSEEARAKTLEDEARDLHAKVTGKEEGTGKVGKYQELEQDAEHKRDAWQTVASAGNFDSPEQYTHAMNMVKAYDAQSKSLQKMTVDQKKYDDIVSKSAIEKLLDPTKANKFGDAMVKAFGNIGKGIVATANALRDYTKETEKNGVAQQKISALDDNDVQKKTLQADLNTKISGDQVKFYGDMAEAASSYFGKQTVGYKVMQDISAAFHAFEIAQSIETFAVKNEIALKDTALAIWTEAKKVFAAVTGSAGVVAAEAPKQAAYGVSALAASLTIPPPMNFVAFGLVAAALLAIGVSIAGSGSSGNVSSAQRQATQGTGTSLGDDKKQSDSIGASIKDIASNTNDSLTYSSKMLSSLKNIEAALTGVTNSLLVNGTDVAGNKFNSASTVGTFGAASAQGIKDILNPLQAFTSKALKTFLAPGFGSSKSLQDSGLTFGSGQTVGSVEQNGLAAQSYQDVQTKHKALFVTYGTSNSRDTQNLDPSTSAAFTDVIKGMVSTVTLAAQGLGMSTTDVADKLKSEAISIKDISLKGLTGDQITKQLEAVFSAFGDKLVSDTLGGTVSKFQQSGEGLLQTAVRVASGVEQASSELNKLGLTAIKFSDVVNTSGDVATEIVRQTIVMKEGATGISDIINTLQGTASDLAKEYASLISVRSSLQQLNIAGDVSSELLNAAGGLQALQTSLSSYTTNYFTTAEQNAMKLQDMEASFTQLGLQMPATRAQFVALVKQLSAGGVAGQDLAAKVLNLADGFNSLSQATTDAAVSTATSDLTTAYNAQVTAITNTKTAMAGFTTSLADFRTSLVTGSLSTGNEVDKYAAEKAKYQDILTKAQAGDQTALAAFQNEASAFLTQSRSTYSSSEQYTSDFNGVLAATTALQQSTAVQSTVADQQLAALNTQVNGLITINQSVLTVTAAIAALQTAITTGVGSASGTSTGTLNSGMKTIMPVTTVNGSHAGGLANVPFNGYIAELHKNERVLTAEQNAAYRPDYSQYGRKADDSLVAEIKSLRQEVTNLRQDNQQQAAAVVAATVQSNEQNAHMIVEGQKQAASQASYVERARVKVA